MEALRKLLMQDQHVSHFIEQLEQGLSNVLVTGLSGSARPAFIDTIFKALNKPIYIMAPNLLQGQKMYDDLAKLLGDDVVHYYPADEFIAADMTVASPELRAARIETLDHLIHDARGVYIIPIAGMRKMMQPKEEWKKLRVPLVVGEDVDINAVLEQLVVRGYSRGEMVTSPGEFALRGGILDVYPPYM